jgi:hypothetical protein
LPGGDYLEDPRPAHDREGSASNELRILHDHEKFFDHGVTSARGLRTSPRTALTVTTQHLINGIACGARIVYLSGGIY